MVATLRTGLIAPTTKAVDAAAVLARMLVPEPMRPGWSESLHHAHSVIPHERLLSIDERLANAAAKPVIIPETINCDRGRVSRAGRTGRTKASVTPGARAGTSPPTRCSPHASASADMSRSP